MANATTDIDELFQLPFNEFTPARNALAAKLKKAGRSAAAAHVKALARPPLAAWAVNQLYWRHRQAFDRLMAAGGKARKAQASRLRGKGGSLHEPFEARRAALSDLTGRAEALLRTSGRTPSPDVMRRITSTLDALATYGGRQNTLRPGRLTDEVAPPGFRALTSLAPPRVIPFRQSHRPRRKPKVDRVEEKRVAAAAVAAAERVLADARRAAARAEAALKKAAARAKQAEQTNDAAASRLETATATAEDARRAARRVAAEAEEAAQAVEDAERALEEARLARKSLAD